MRRPPSLLRCSNFGVNKMMKKTVISLIVAGLSITSGLSQAADNVVTQVPSGTAIENTAAGCSILRDRVTVITSNGVTMAYNCLTARTKVNLASCHSSGSQKPTSINCQVVDEDEDGDPIFNLPGCTPEGQLTTPVQSITISGRRAFVASTTGGSVSGTELNSETCGVAALGGLSTMTQ